MQYSELYNHFWCPCGLHYGQSVINLQQNINHFLSSITKWISTSSFLWSGKWKWLWVTGGCEGYTCACFKISRMKDAKQRIKDPSNWDGLPRRLMIWQSRYVALRGCNLRVEKQFVLFCNFGAVLAHTKLTITMLGCFGYLLGHC